MGRQCESTWREHSANEEIPLAQSAERWSRSLTPSARAAAPRKPDGNRPRPPMHQIGWRAGVDERAVLRAFETSNGVPFDVAHRRTATPLKICGRGWLRARLLGLRYWSRSVARSWRTCHSEGWGRGRTCASADTHARSSTATTHGVLAATMYPPALRMAGASFLLRSCSNSDVPRPGAQPATPANLEWSLNCRRLFSKKKIYVPA